MQLLKLCLFVFIGGLSACTNEAPLPKAEQLAGKWLIVNAKRNEKNTDILNGAHFTFEANNTLLTNLPISSETDTITTYSFDKNKLTCHGNPEIVYEVSNYADSTMQLSFEKSGISFVLFLSRSK